MRTIDVSEITALVRQLCMQANYHLSPDLCTRIEQARSEEQSPLGQEIFDQMIDNYRLADRDEVPICQDCGMAVVFAELGQEVHLTGGLLEDAVNEGVRQGYVQGYLRLSVVRDPLRRENTNDNTPAVLYTRLVEGEQLRIIVAPKGFGSENMSTLKMFTPAATREDIIQYIVNCCDRAGSNPCPPIVIGVGLGGTADKAAYLAKRALLRDVSQHADDPFYAEMETEIVQRVNALGIGPQGLGGTVTTLSCAIEPFATHIAGLPCAVCLGCHVTRHAEGVL